MKSRKSKRYTACNIISANGEGPRLWSFNYRQKRPILHATRTIGDGETIPRQLVGKDWKILLNPVANVAWIPGDEIFLRVVHLPTDDPNEVPDMLELQLEKLSPVPLSQIVWSFEIFPPARPNQVTAVVVMTERKAMEGILGHLEERGFLADQLTSPHLHRLKALHLTRDGTYIIPDPGPHPAHCMVAWIYDGLLQHISLLKLDSDSNWEEILVKELNQIAWSGEIEGWLKSEPHFTLVADPEHQDVLSPLIKRLGENMNTEGVSISSQDVALFNASEVSRSDHQANLMPKDVVSRYRQRFIDGLWMKAFGAIIVLYLIGVGVYFGLLEYSKYQRDEIRADIQSMSGTYTNALQLSEKIKILERQENLKFAALDCWLEVVKVLPAELSFKRFDFKMGRNLILSGTAPTRQNSKVTSYRNALEQINVRGKPLFSEVVEKSRNEGRGELNWTFECRLHGATES